MTFYCSASKTISNISSYGSASPHGDSYGSQITADVGFRIRVGRLGVKPCLDDYKEEDTIEFEEMRLVFAKV
jgi:hypothetical protein